LDETILKDYYYNENKVLVPREKPQPEEEDGNDDQRERKSSKSSSRSSDRKAEKQSAERLGGKKTIVPQVLLTAVVDRANNAMIVPSIPMPVLNMEPIALQRPRPKEIPKRLMTLPIAVIPKRASHPHGRSSSSNNQNPCYRAPRAPTLKKNCCLNGEV
jgi:hypothetical protein